MVNQSRIYLTKPCSPECLQKLQELAAEALGYHIPVRALYNSLAACKPGEEADSQLVAIRASDDICEALRGRLADVIKLMEAHTSGKMWPSEADTPEAYKCKFYEYVEDTPDAQDGYRKEKAEDI